MMECCLTYNNGKGSIRKGEVLDVAYPEFETGEFLFFCLLQRKTDHAL